MNRLLSGAVGVRTLIAALLSLVIGVVGLGGAPPASAAKPGTIEGTVTDADGGGIKGIVVTAYELEGVDGWASVASDKTRNDGSYTLKHLAAGAYRVEFRDDADTYVDEFYDDQRAIDLAADVPVADGQAVSGIDAQLELTGSISGTVTDEQGQPLPGMFVNIYTVDEDGLPTGSPAGGTTNAAGRFLIPSIAPGDYIVGFADLDGNHVTEYYDDHLDIFDSDRVTVTPGAVSDGIDAELAVGGHIAGTVTDSAGHPVPDLEVDVARLVDGDWLSFGEELGFRTRDDGTYQVDGLPAGTSRVGFVDPAGDYLAEYYDNAPTFQDAQDLALPAGGTLSGIDATLEEATHVRGTVTNQADDPLEGISVTAWAREGDHWAIFGDTETDADGSYSIDGLRAGDYRVEFQSQGDYADEYYDDADSIEAATPVVTHAGETVSGIDAVLAPAAHIIGRVTDSSGTGLQAAVFALRKHGDTWEDFGFAFTGDGDYDIGSLSPGIYRLEFLTFDAIAAHEYWNDQPSLELANDVVVTQEGQVLTGYDAVLVDGQYPSEVENITPPTVVGSPVVGQTLTAAPGTWNLAATTFHFQWFAGTTPVGADTSSYSPSAADVGKTISVTVVGSVPGLGSAMATSAPTAPVSSQAVPPPPPPPAAPKSVVNLTLPVIKGILRAGHRARVTTGRWNPAVVDLTYRWFVGGKRIARSDKHRLVLKQKWVGKRLWVKVIARAGGYSPAAIATRRSATIKS